MIIIPSGKKIKKIREKAGLTQTGAADLVHLSSAKRWSEYENETRRPDKARWELFLIKIGHLNGLNIELIRDHEKNIYHELSQKKIENHILTYLMNTNDTSK
jgi:transcriptional regulator with XRE-family HTH domain